MAGLRISRELELPVDVAGEAIGILAKRGAGKTNTAVVLVEEMHRAGVQVVVLDPVGVWWGIRAGADGHRKDGLPMPVLGGEHGDVALEPAAGELVADVVVDSGQSLVVDVSEFSKTQQRSFVAAFATRLYRRKASARSLLHVVLEEADEFAPQRVTSGDAPMVGAIAQLVKRGRSRGLGLTFVTQRSASLNKDVLDQADVLIAMRTIGPRDRKAIEGWIEHQDADGADQVLPSLPQLETGEAWVWNPERAILSRAKVRKRSTFDSSATPKAGEKRAEPKETAAIDLTALGKRIEETAERAKQNDPAELRRQIRELDRRVRQADENTARLEALLAREPEEKLVVETIETRVEVPALTDEERELLAEVRTAYEHHEAAARAVLEALDEISNRLGAQAPAQLPRPSRETRAPAVARASSSGRTGGSQPERAERTAAREPARAAVAAPPSGDLTGPQQRVLDALAWLQVLGFDQPTKIQVGFIAGYRVGKRVGGTFGNILGQLRADGLLDYPSAGTVSLTESGSAVATVPNIERSARGFQDAVYARLDGPERRVLQVIVDVYPDAVSKQECGRRAGYTVGDRVGGTFGNILGRLRTLGLIDYPTPGHVVALEVLFP